MKKDIFLTCFRIVLRANLHDMACEWESDQLRQIQAKLVSTSVPAVTRDLSSRRGIAGRSSLSKMGLGAELIRER